MPVNTHGALLVLLLLSAAIAASWLTKKFRLYAIEKRLLDLPNERSSHAVPTPRGGGVAFVLVTLVALPLLGWYGHLQWRAVLGFAGGGALIACIGFVDDRGHIPAGWRLVGHFMVAAWFLLWVGKPAYIPFLGADVRLGLLGYGVASIYIVWLINLTNFMDGIDGLAGVETITVCFGGALFWIWAKEGSGESLTPMVLASAIAGFLVWNWPPAKIFMGDAGSGFLGLMFAGLSLQAASFKPILIWSWVILLGVFIADATFTLIRRLARREKFYKAHRSHAYQHAAMRCGSHRSVILVVGAINIGWLLPLAIFVALGRLDGLLGLAISYTPLVGAAFWLRAGEP